MRTLDRILGWTLLCVAIAHLALFYFRPEWAGSRTAEGALGLALAGMLLSAMNLMRAERPHDRTLARVCVVANASLLMLLIAFTADTHHLPGPLMEATIVLALLPISMRTRRRSRPM